MNIPEHEYMTAYHERKEHAGREFPFNIYPCSIPGDFQAVSVHWHEEMEIISVKKGRGLVSVESAVSEMKAGDIVIVFPGQLHGIMQKEGETMEYENILFLPSMLMASEEDLCTRRFLMPLVNQQAPEPLHMKKGQEGYEDVAWCIDRLDALSGKRPVGYQMAVKGQLFELLYQMLNYMGPVNQERPRKSREKIKQVLEYIEAHYGEDLSVEKAAELCFYSKSHFMKYFKQYTGIPFTEYLNDYRLSRAGAYLRLNEDTVTEIAARCGFDNLSYFNRLFRKKYGMTPGEYRKKR